MNQTENALALAGNIGGKNRLNCIANLPDPAIREELPYMAELQAMTDASYWILFFETMHDNKIT